MYRRRQWHPTPVLLLENPMDRGALWAAGNGVAKSQTLLSDFIFTFHFQALEKEMATHSSVLAWRIPGTAEPGGLPSMGSHRVGHDWSDLAAARCFCSWHHPFGRKWRGPKKPLDESERDEWKVGQTQDSENEDRGIWSHHFMGNRWGNSRDSVRVYFWGLQNHCRWWLQPSN